MKQCDVLVIGSGPAGQKAAIQSAKSGRSVVLVEQEKQVGGMCVHKGTIPSKALRESAHRYRTSRTFLATHSPTELAPLMHNVGAVINAHDGYITSQLTRNGIECITGRARFVNQYEVQVLRPGGRELSIRARHIFIATGSRPRKPPEVEVDHQVILDSDSILSMSYLPDSMVVLGGGVIACEYASVFLNLGARVTLIDRFEVPLGFLDRDLSRRFVADFEAHGGVFMGNTQVTSARYDGISSAVVTLEDGAEVRAEKLLTSLGRVSNIQGLDVASAGVEVTDFNLIAVNQHCQTNIPHIYAIGDVIGPPSLASASMEQGRRAARHALGLTKPDHEDVIPVGIYAMPELASVGLTEAEARAEHGEVVIGVAEFREIARGLIAGTEEGMLKMIAEPESKRIIGVHIVGEGASELIHLGQLALMNDMSVDGFVDRVFNFPTLAEAYRVAALSIQGQLTNKHPARIAASP